LRTLPDELQAYPPVGAGDEYIHKVGEIR
jgi:hypothetical protein